VWNDLIEIKNLYLVGRLVKIGNDVDTDFWRDPWCGNIALREKFRDLFFFSKDAGELRFIILKRRRKGKIP
jgi:hypothetical protein